MSTIPIRLALALAVTTGLSACTTTPPATNRAEPAHGPNENLAVSPRTMELAEQAQRDVEQLRGLQDPIAEETRTASKPPEIQWILPRATPPAGPAPERVAPSGRATVQSPLAGSTPEASKSTPTPPPESAAADEPGGGLAAYAGDNPLRQEIVQLSAALYREAAYSDMPLPELLLITATALVTPDRALATEALPGLTDRERELLDHLQTHFARLGRALAEKGDPEAIVAEVAALHKALDKQPRLNLPRAALCTRVGGFGDFDEFSRNQSGRYAFLAHNGQQAVVYVEVEDFTSELNEKGQWVTELSQQLVVYSDRDGIPVWREDWQAGVDASKNRRDDFFIVQLVTLPKRLSVGRYHLKLHIRDEKSGAEAETALEFEMVADPRLAAP